MSGMKTIKEFEVNERVYANALIKKATKGMTTRNQPYLDLILIDKESEISGKIWDVVPEQEAMLQPNSVVYVTGMVTVYNGQNQLKVEYIDLVKNADVTEYVRSAPIEADVMEKKIITYIESMEDSEMCELVMYLFEQHQTAFKTHPAAFGMHHAIYAGLAYHTLTMLEVGDKLHAIYPFLKRDLLIGGIVLHDLAKVIEMNAQNGVAESYTRPGNLLGHIVQAILLIGEAGYKLGTDEVKVEVLQHMVASHHGKGEWGSPQPPKMAEALMLHHIDNIDAKMYMVKDAIDQADKDAEFTGKIRGLENNQFYIYKL